MFGGGGGGGFYYRRLGGNDCFGRLPFTAAGSLLISRAKTFLRVSACYGNYTDKMACYLEYVAGESRDVLPKHNGTVAYSPQEHNSFSLPTTQRAWRRYGSETRGVVLPHRQRDRGWRHCRISEDFLSNICVYA